MHPKYLTLRKQKVYVGYSKGLPKWHPFCSQLKRNHQYCDLKEKYSFQFEKGRLAPEVQSFLLDCGIDKLCVFSFEDTDWSATECERVQLCYIIAPITSEEQYQLISSKAKFKDHSFGDCCPCWCEFPGISK